MEPSTASIQKVAHPSGKKTSAYRTPWPGARTARRFTSATALPTPFIPSTTMKELEQSPGKQHTSRTTTRAFLTDRPLMPMATCGMHATAADRSEEHTSELQ